MNNKAPNFILILIALICIIIATILTVSIPEQETKTITGAAIPTVKKDVCTSFEQEGCSWSAKTPSQLRECIRTGTPFERKCCTLELACSYNEGASGWGYCSYCPNEDSSVCPVNCGLYRDTFSCKDSNGFGCC